MYRRTVARGQRLPDDGPVGYRGVANAILDLVESGRFRQERVAVARDTR